MTTSPGRVGKALANRAELKDGQRGERGTALYDHVPSVKIKHDYITSLS